MNVQLGGGEGELLDGVDLLWEGADPLGVHRVTQEGHGGLGQHTLLEVDGEAVLPESGEHLPQCCSCSSRDLEPTKISSM